MLATDLPFVHTREGSIDGMGYMYLKKNEEEVGSPALAWKILSSAAPATSTSLGNWTETVPKIPSDVYDKTGNESLRRSVSMTADISSTPEIPPKFTKTKVLSGAMLMTSSEKRGC
jgi:hypothetical protein